MKAILLAAASAAVSLQFTTAHAGMPYKIVTANPRHVLRDRGRPRQVRGARCGHRAGGRADLRIGREHQAAALRARCEVRDRPGRRLSGIRGPRPRRQPEAAASSGRCASSCRSTTPRSITSRAPTRELNYLHEIKDAKINGGLVGSGAAFITHTLYRMMFNSPMPEANASYLSNEEALVKLIGDKSGGCRRGRRRAAGADHRQHEARGAEIHQAAEVRSGASREQAPLTIYAPSTVRATSYPNLLKRQLDHDLGRRLPRHLRLQPARHGRLPRRASRARSARTSPRCRRRAIPSGARWSSRCRSSTPGWTYYGPTTKELRACIAGARGAAPKAAKSCSAEERILGFCN